MFSCWSPNNGLAGQSEGPIEGDMHLLLHLSHLNQWRQGEGHIKYGCFHGVLLTKVTVAVGISSHWHILRHLMHLNQWRQGEGHIKDGCFHGVLLTVVINTHSAMRLLLMREP